MKLMIQFMFSLTFGLVGLGLVMKIFMDRVFIDFDVYTAVKNFFNGISERAATVNHHRAEDLMMHAENSRPRELTTRLIERRREELRAMDEVESALSRPRESSVALAPALNAPSEVEGWAGN